jgi:hypothetical protein
VSIRQNVMYKDKIIEEEKSASPKSSQGMKSDESNLTLGKSPSKGFKFEVQPQASRPLIRESYSNFN